LEEIKYKDAEENARKTDKQKMKDRKIEKAQHDKINEEIQLFDFFAKNKSKVTELRTLLAENINEQEDRMLQNEIDLL